MQIKEFAQKHGLKLTAALVNSRPDGAMDDMPKGTAHWECTLTRGTPSPILYGRTIYWSSGPGNRRFKRHAIFCDMRGGPRPKPGDRVPSGYGRTLAQDQCLASCTEPIPPTVDDVLDSLKLDAGCADAQTFEDFCGEFGYDTDSRKAERTYNACRDTATLLRRFLGAAFDELMECEGL